MLELRFPTAEQLRAVYENDLTEAFPAAELKPLRNIWALWEAGRYEPWCLFDGEAVLGVCFLWQVEPGWALLDYLCVTAGRRNGGMGGLLLEKLRQIRPDCVILGEVEAPEAAPDPAMARRRLGFYRRNHARVAGYDAEAFGVHYKTIYWSGEPIADEALMHHHAEIYRRSFSPDKYARYIRIPLPEHAPPLPQVPWQG